MTPAGTTEADARLRPEGTLRQAVALGLSGGFFALVVALAAVAVVIPALAGATPLTVLTGSMAPRLPPGTLIIVRPEPLEKIRIGDVLSYQITLGQPALVSHRVVQVSARGDGTLTFTTRGDANARPDPLPVTPQQVRGVVWYSVPYVGYLSTALSGGARRWLAPFVGAALLAYAIWNLAAVIRNRTRPSKGSAVGSRR